MPLPTADTPWPPTDTTVQTALADWDAWYSADPGRWPRCVDASRPAPPVPPRSRCTASACRTTRSPIPRAEDWAWFSHPRLGNTAGTRAGVIKWRTPTHGSSFDVPPFLVRLLDAHMASWPSDYPFSTPSGTLWRAGNFSRVLRPAADGREGIPRKVGFAGRTEWKPIVPGFTMRGARHTHDTWMKEDNVDRALRFLTMGWVPKDIEGTYEHVTPEMRRHRLDSLEARWARGKRVASWDAGESSTEMIS